ncbi:MAG: penicillin-binding transpeptidase domain-containing protein, partial [Pseudomonadota bacterium]
NGHLPRDEAEEAKARPLETLFNSEIESRLPSAPPLNYFTDEIRRQLDAQLGADALYGGGLSVRATIDPELQRIAEKALRGKLLSAGRERDGYRGPVDRIEGLSADDEQGWREALAGADAPDDIEGWRKAVVLEVGQRSARVGIHGVEEDEDGHYVRFDDVKGWARRREDGEARFGPAPQTPDDVWEVGDVVLVEGVTDDEGAFDRWVMRQVPEIQGAFMVMDPATGRVLALVGGFSYEHSVFNRATQAKRQPGSSFKPFVYAAALDNGYSPATIVMDAPVVVEQPGEDWKPKNYSGKFYGPSPLRLGIEKSRNLMTVRLAQDVGMHTVAEYAERFGVYDSMPLHLSYSLGAGETTLWKMVAAYGMFANGGRRVEPTLVDRIQNRRGETIYRHDRRDCAGCAADAPGAHEPWPAPTARRIMDRVTAFQLVSMMEGVTTRGTAADLSSLGYPMAGKTGTTNDNKDAWFVGFTPNLVAGCFIGYDQPRPMGKGGTGGGMCAPVFKAFMAEAMETRRPGVFTPPDDVVWAKVDRFTGQRLPDDAAGGSVISEAFRFGQAPGLYETEAVIGESGPLSFNAAGDLPLTITSDRRRGETGVFETAPTRPTPSGGFGDDVDSGLY